MPPKPKPVQPSKKADQKKKEKVIEDKTFGLKNKKGAKQQKFIQQVQKQVQQQGVPARKLAATDPKKTDKEAKLQEQKELSMLFKPVQKVEKGADPKTVLCAFYKQGQCGKGAKCKFSHDLTIERKAEKRSVYVDMRDDDEDDKLRKQDDLMRLDDKRPTTDIVCKYFLDAVESSLYGWFWKCPMGDGCKYRHALPPGYVLKKDLKKEKKQEISLEELIERERAALASQKFTKITLETFLAWKKRKLKEKQDAIKKDEEKKRQDFKAGRQCGLSGREMFSFNPELAAGDMTEDGDEAFGDYRLNDDEAEDSNRYREIQLDIIEGEAQEVDESGTQASEDRLLAHAMKMKEFEEALSGAKYEEQEEAGEASGSAMPINENLFLQDDLDDIDQELEELDLDDDEEDDDDEDPVTS